MPASPVVVAFDGSPPSVAALRVAAEELPGRLLLVVSVWEPALTTAVLTPADATGLSAPLPDPEQVSTIERLQRDHAGATADAGVALAEQSGARAEAVPERDASSIAEAVLAVAERRDAGIIVVGSRGLGAVKARLLGSTTRRLLHDARRPVLVVRNGEKP